MSLLPPFLAEVGVGDLAQLLIFVVLAIGAAIQQAMKKRAEERRREEAAGRHQRRSEPAPPHAEPAHAPPPRRPPPPPPSASQPQRRPAPPTAAPAPVGSHGGRIHTLAEPRKRAGTLTGRRLLFAQNPSAHDRVRAAVLWHEVLGPPPSSGA